MSEQPDMFPEIVARIVEPKVAPFAYPYFIVAYWPRGGWWTVNSETYESPDCDAIKRDISRKQGAGWTHITIMKLPSSLWDQPDEHNQTNTP